MTYAEFVKGQSAAFVATGAVATPVMAFVTARDWSTERIATSLGVLAVMLAALAWPLLAREGPGERALLRAMDLARDRAAGVIPPVGVPPVPPAWSPYHLPMLVFGGSLLATVISPEALGPSLTAASAFGVLLAYAQRRGIRAIGDRERREGTLYLLVGLQGLVRPVLRIVRPADLPED